MSIAISIPENIAAGAGTHLPGLFVSQDWLQDNLQASDLRIIQVGGEKYFASMHIPGALLLSYNQIVEIRDGIMGLRGDRQKLQKLFGSLGIAPQTHVVAYDLSGGMDGARLIWTLCSLGHLGGGAVLDGGLGRWYEEKRPMEQDVSTVAAVEFDGEEDGRWLAEADEIGRLSNGDWSGLLIDVRSHNEYIGNVLKAPRGHIKGARHFEWTQVLRGPRDSRLQDPGAIKELFAAVGAVDPDQEIILYCETGHRAAQTWLLLRHLGFTNVRLFDGSISEWRVRDLPVVAGNSPE